MRDNKIKKGEKVLFFLLSSPLFFPLKTSPPILLFLSGSFEGHSSGSFPSSYLISIISVFLIRLMMLLPTVLLKGFIPNTPLFRFFLEDFQHSYFRSI